MNLRRSKGSRDPRSLAGLGGVGWGGDPIHRPHAIRLALTTAPCNKSQCIFPSFLTAQKAAVLQIPAYKTPSCTLAFSAKLLLCSPCVILKVEKAKLEWGSWPFAISPVLVANGSAMAPPTLQCLPVHHSYILHDSANHSG